MSIDHEFAFGFMDPFGSMEPVHIRSFPKNIDFKIFIKIYDRIAALSDEQYAQIIAPLLLFAQGLGANNLERFEVRRLNWIMGFLMEARTSFMQEMRARIPELQNEGYTVQNHFKEILPYEYFVANASKKPNKSAKLKKNKKSR